MASRRIAIAALGAIGLAAVVVVWLGRETLQPAQGADEATPWLGLRSDGLSRDAAASQALTALLPGVAVRPARITAGSGEGEGGQNDALAPLAGALCDQVTAGLWRLPGVRVVPCGSTRTAAAAALDDQALGQVLATRFVVHSDLATAGTDRVRLRLALHDLAQPGEPWAAEAEGEPGALQALPQQLAERLAQALGQPLPAPPQAITPAQQTRLLRAIQLARQADLEARRQAWQMVDALAGELPTHGQVRYLKAALATMGAGPRIEAPDARRAAAAALAQDMRETAELLVAGDAADPRGHILLLNVALRDKDWLEVFRHADTLAQLGRRTPMAARIAARIHLYAGYRERALVLAQAAARGDALDADSLEALALAHGVLGDDARMREALTQARQLGHRGLGLHDMMLALRRRDDDGLAAAAQAWADWTNQRSQWVAPFVAALRPDAAPEARDAALTAFAAMDEAARYGMLGYFIEHVLLGAANTAIDVLAPHAKEPPSRWVEQLWWPELAPLRSHPGFAGIVEDLGLPALWAVRGAPDLCGPDAQGRWRCR